MLAQAPGRPTIHEYADAAACQMGGREFNYLPSGILPGGNKIPITWQGKELKWVPKNMNPDKSFVFDGLGSFQLFDDKGIGSDIPAAMNGPFDDPTQSSVVSTALKTTYNVLTGKNLRCDHFSYVEPSCAPDQFVREIFQGRCLAGANQGNVCSADDQCPASSCTKEVRWHILFRRTAAAAKSIDNNPATLEPLDWKTGIYTSYYKVVDAIGLKLSTYGTVWLDGLGSAAQDFQNGFRKGPMPRPGGKRPDLRQEGIRATKWFDTPDTMVGGACNGCHGTPFNGSDWIKQSGLKFGDDDASYWWHAGNGKAGFPSNTFFTNANNSVTKKDYDCTGCHRLWMTNAASTPGGEQVELPGIFPFARFMTMVQNDHVAIGLLNDSKGVPDVDNPFRPLFRSFLVPDGKGGMKLAESPAGTYARLASDFRIDQPQMAFLDKNSQQTHWMGFNRPNTVRDWGAKYSEEYTNLACCGAGLAGVNMQPPNTGDFGVFSCQPVTCTKNVSQDSALPGFITPWMQANGKTPIDTGANDETQTIEPPDAVTNVSLSLAACPAAIVPANPGDTCFRLAWSDPNGSPFNAPQTFHVNQKLPNKKVTDPDWAPADIQATRFCGDGTPAKITIDPASNIFPKAMETQIPAAAGDKWRYSYETFGPIAACQKMAIRLCGGWCGQTFAVAGDAGPVDRVSTDGGQLLTLANDTTGDVTNQFSITLSGFRKNNTTGRFLQTVFIAVTGANPVPAPLSFVLKNLSANATLFNASGSIAPASPFINIVPGGDSLQFAPKQVITFTLEFSNPTNQAITYTAQALALSISGACK